MDLRVSSLSSCCDAIRNAFDHESLCLFFRADRVLGYPQRRRHACVVCIKTLQEPTSPHCLHLRAQFLSYFEKIAHMSVV